MQQAIKNWTMQKYNNFNSTINRTPKCHTGWETPDHFPNTFPLTGHQPYIWSCVCYDSNQNSGPWCCNKSHPE